MREGHRVEGAVEVNGVFPKNAPASARRYVQRVRIDGLVLRLGLEVGLAREAVEQHVGQQQGRTAGALPV